MVPLVASLSVVLAHAGASSHAEYDPWWLKGRVVLRSGTQRVLPLPATRVGVGDERVVAVRLLGEALLVIGGDEGQTVVDVWTGPGPPVRLTVKVVNRGICELRVYRPFPHHLDEADFVLSGAVTLRLVGDRLFLEGRLETLHQLRFLRARWDDVPRQTLIDVTVSEGLLEALVQELRQLARGRGETAVSFSALNGFVLVEGVVDDPQVAREIALMLEELQLPTEGGQRDVTPDPPPQPPRGHPNAPRRMQAGAHDGLRLEPRRPPA
jgi:hypothetical protein